MTVFFAYPKPLVAEHKGDVLTFVVPAPNGCDLKCSYCFIGQRGERDVTGPVLRPQDYKELVEAWLSARDTACVAIQGEEPLLPESLEYTFAILTAAKARGALTSIITNGTHLEQNAQALKDAQLDFLCVSLDAADAGRHDRLRGVAGAFQRTLGGLRAAVPLFGDNLLVSSVLLPRKSEYLIGLPRLLASLGVKRWGVNPLVRVPAEGSSAPAADRRETGFALRRLYDEARRFSVDAMICDDLDCLGDLRQTSAALRDIPFKLLGPSRTLIRVLPNGHCDGGSAILSKVAPTALRWNPGTTSAAAFVELVQREHLS